MTGLSFLSIFKPSSLIYRFFYCYDLVYYLWYESEVAQSCPTLCDLMDCSLPGSSVHGIFQARVLEWFAISSSRESSHPRDQTQVSCIVGRCFTIWTTRKDAICGMKVNVIPFSILFPQMMLKKTVDTNILAYYNVKLKFSVKSQSTHWDILMTWQRSELLENLNCFHRKRSLRIIVILH